MWGIFLEFPFINDTKVEKGCFGLQGIKTLKS